MAQPGPSAATGLRSAHRRIADARRDAWPRGTLQPLDQFDPGLSRSSPKRAPSPLPGGHPRRPWGERSRLWRGDRRRCSSKFPREPDRGTAEGEAGFSGSRVAQSNDCVLRRYRQGGISAPPPTVRVGVAPGRKMPDRYVIMNRGLVNEKAPPGCPERR